MTCRRRMIQDGNTDGGRAGVGDLLRTGEYEPVGIVEVAG